MNETDGRRSLRGLGSRATREMGLGKVGGSELLDPTESEKGRVFS